LDKLSNEVEYPFVFMGFPDKYFKLPLEILRTATRAPRAQGIGDFSGISESNFRLF
jgi:hypothetical protein